MSAECSTCGSDLVYGDEWPDMFCQVCSLRDERDRLLEERDNAGFVTWAGAQDAIDELTAERDKLPRKVEDYERGEEPLARQLQDENDRLREALERGADELESVAVNEFEATPAFWRLKTVWDDFRQVLKGSSDE